MLPVGRKSDRRSKLGGVHQCGRGGVKNEALFPGRVPDVRPSVHGPKRTGRSPISANLSVVVSPEPRYAVGTMENASNKDWDVLSGLFPVDWRKEAVLSGAVERLRGFPSVDMLLRTLLLHVGKGFSLRETAVRAKLADWADVSDVALLQAPAHQRVVAPWTLPGVAKGGWF